MQTYARAAATTTTAKKTGVVRGSCLTIRILESNNIDNISKKRRKVSNSLTKPLYKPKKIVKLKMKKNVII